jgi:mannose-6-phosphate isomerase-like protein (cupin superfamily)
MPTVVALRKVAAELSEFWSPRVVGEVDDSYVKVAKVKGTLTWHSHEQEDELFLVLKGRLRIEMERESVELREGEMFVVPKAHDTIPLPTRSVTSSCSSGSPRRILEM